MATIRVSFLLGGKRFHGRLNRFFVLSDVPAKATCVNRAGPGYKVIRLRRLSHTRQYRTDQGAFLRRPAGDRRTRIGISSESRLGSYAGRGSPRTMEVMKRQRRSILPDGGA
jgi:hypothetical protein